MQRKNFAGHSGVVVDWCGSHGTWLDTHEMEDIAAFVIEGGLQSIATESMDANWSLPADPGKAAAVLAAERLLAEERARARVWHRGSHIDSGRIVKGIGDLFAKILR